MGNIENILTVLADSYTYCATHPERRQTREVYEELNGLIGSCCMDDRRPQVMRAYELYASHPDRPDLWVEPLGDSLRLLGADHDSGILTVTRVLASRLPGGPRLEYDEDDDMERRRGGGDILGYRNPGRPGVRYDDFDDKPADAGRGAGNPTIPYEDDGEEDTSREADTGAY